MWFFCHADGRKIWRGDTSTPSRMAETMSLLVREAEFQRHMRRCADRLAESLRAENTVLREVLESQRAQIAMQARTIRELRRAAEAAGLAQGWEVPALQAVEKTMREGYPTPAEENADAVPPKTKKRGRPALKRKQECVGVGGAAEHRVHFAATVSSPADELWADSVLDLC